MANSTIRDLLVRISANATGLDRELTTAIGKTKRFGAEMTAIGQTLAIGVSAPIIAVGAAAVKAAADLDALERGLKATTKEAGPLTLQMERLRQIAKLPGLGFQEAVQGSINLQAVGYSAAQSERFLKVFGNTLAAVGRGRADLDGVIVQLQQMAGKSKILAEDIKPLIQRVPQLGAAMIKLYGTIDTEKLQKMGISSKQFISDVTGELEKLPAATGGARNAMENFSDSVNQAMARVGKVLIENFQLDKKIDDMGAAIERAGKKFSEMDPAMQKFVTGMTALTASLPLVIFGVGTLIEKTAVIVKFFREWAIAGQALALVFNPITVALGFLAINIGRVSEAWEKLKSEWNNDAFLLRLRDRWKDMETATRRTLDALAPTVPAFALVASSTRAAGNAAEITKEQLKKLAEQAYRVRDAWDASHERAEKFAEDYIKAAGQLNELTGQLSKSEADLAIDYGKAHERIREESLKTVEITATAWERMPSAVRAALTETARFGQAIKDVNADLMRMDRPTQMVSEETVRVSRENFEAIAKSGKASAAQVLAAWVSYYQRHLALARANGKEVSAEQQKALDDARTKLDELDGRIDGHHSRVKSESEKTWNLVQKQTGRTFDHMARGMADSIVKWKGFGETMQSIGQDFASGMLEIFNRRLLDPLQKKLESVIAGVFGGGGDPTKQIGVIKDAIDHAAAGHSVSGAATSTGGSTASTGGTVVSGLMGTLGAVGSIASAVSGVIGNFQISGMNKSLDLVVKHTLQTANDLSNLRADAWMREAHLFTKLDDHAQFTWRKLDDLINAVRDGGMGGGQTLQLVVDGKVLAQAVAKALPRYSPSFA